MSEQKVLLNQMPIAIKDSKIDITSEKLTKELDKEFTKYLKGGEFIFFNFAKLFIEISFNLNLYIYTSII